MYAYICPHCQNFKKQLTQLKTRYDCLAGDYASLKKNLNKTRQRQKIFDSQNNHLHKLRIQHIAQIQYLKNYINNLNQTSNILKQQDQLIVQNRTQEKKVDRLNKIIGFKNNQIIQLQEKSRKYQEYLRMSQISINRLKLENQNINQSLIKQKQKTLLLEQEMSINRKVNKTYIPTRDKIQLNKLQDDIKTNESTIRYNRSTIQDRIRQIQKQNNLLRKQLTVHI